MTLMSVDFAGAVLAEDGMDAAAMDGQLGLFQRPDTAIALGHAFHAEERNLPASIPFRPRLKGAAGKNPRRRGYVQSSLYYWLASDWPMISCAVKLMPQVGKALPTKKLSDWVGVVVLAVLEVRDLRRWRAAA